MAITPLGAIGYTNATSQSTDAAASAATSSVANPKGILDRDAFLKLLVAQLRYQDPSKPLDPTEMVSQSAQLTVVDKLNEISGALTQSSVIDRLALAGSVIGKDISFASPEGYPVTAQVTSVRFEGSSLVLRAGTYEVALESVQSVAEHPVTPPPAPAAAPAPAAPAPAAPAPPAAPPPAPSA
jgi:flagellar basal-body rod modification protein FlgD